MKNLMRPNLGLILPESRAFVAEAFALDVDGALPDSVREHYPCHDIPLAPEGTLLAPWSARDAAAWMSNWPPSDGELYVSLGSVQHTGQFSPSHRRLAGVPDRSGQLRAGCHEA